MVQLAFTLSIPAELSALEVPVLAQVISPIPLDNTIIASQLPVLPPVPPVVTPVPPVPPVPP